MFRISINAQEVAQKLRAQLEVIKARLQQEAAKLSIAAHGEIVRYAQQNLTGWRLQHFLGDTGQDNPDSGNVRWYKAADNVWVVEIDESVAWIEQGRPSVFMDWLLKPGAKGVKIAKDGSLYRSIPMMQSRGKGGKVSAPGILGASIKHILKQNKVSLNKIETDLVLFEDVLD